jgi:penicillin amidase
VKGRTWRQPGFRPLRWLIVLTLVALGLAGVGVWHLLGRVVPSWDGARSVPGLRAPVEVLTDRWSVPHIYARDAEDAWMAIGYLHGRERLWQMEVYRRATGGRLSELFGESTVPADKRFVALGLRRVANAEWQTAAPLVRTALERYAEGVNAAAGDMGRWQRPAEFMLLGLEFEPWTAVDSLAVGRLLGWRLSENRRGELVRGRLIDEFGAGVANRLMGNPPASAPTIVGSGERAASSRGSSPAVEGLVGTTVQRSVLPPGLRWLDMTAPPGGSNSWVVSGARTASGRPMLANDPHLRVEMPSIWYEAHLVAAGLDVAGATLPGTPFVLIGHNARVAWGVTNSGADVQDFYVEDVDMSRRSYRYRGAWEPLRVDTYEIDIRGRDRPEKFDVFSTRHGPLVATETNWEDPPELSTATGRQSPRLLALRWQMSGETAGAFEAINRASDWESFLRGVRRLGTPSQNFVYADVDGNIGYALSGRLPLRGGADGGAPLPGWTGEGEWIGEVPPERLPAVLNPEAGQLVTANGEIDRRWPGTMTRDWRAYFRTRRIVELLGARTSLTADDMVAIQLDVHAEAGDPILRALEEAAQSPAFGAAEPEARAAVERLRLWDRQVDGRPVVALYEAFLRALWRRTFADEMDADLFEAFFEYGLGERYMGVYAIIDNRTSDWWNDIATIDRHETRDDIVLLAAADAALGLRAQFGDESDWAWDRLHGAHFRHVLGAGGFLLDWVLSRGPVPTVGDGWTVRKASVNVESPYSVEDIASYRQIIEVGDWDATRAINSTGQTGHTRSPHYFDQNPLWRDGQYRSFPFSRAAVDREKAARLLLTP